MKNNEIHPTTTVALHYVTITRAGDRGDDLLTETVLHTKTRHVTGKIDSYSRTERSSFPLPQ